MCSSTNQTIRFRSFEQLYLNMKKYQQLLLAILSIFSFSCLLIYRHEYNRLRYVLEVLNFFGTPGVSNATPLACGRNGTLNRFMVSDFPPPAWQRIGNSLYIYSAFWVKNEEKEYVQTFAIGMLNENLNYGCNLWYDSNPKTKAGVFSFSALAYKPQDTFNNKPFGKSKTKPFVFYCESDTKGLTPVGVTFYKTNLNGSSQGFLPVASLPTSLPVTNSTGICIMPTPFSNFNRSTYLEFLGFHNVLGVNSFIIYGSNDQHNLLSSIQRDHSNKLDLKILQWNYPFFGDNEVMRVVAENDCKTRATGLFENVLILDWNKFFVPRYLFSISKILNELDHDKKCYKFQFSNLLFCTEYVDDPKSNSSSPVIFKKTRYSIPKLDTPVPAYRPHMKVGRVQKVWKGAVAIHQYTSCRDIKIKSGDKKSDRVDASILAFQSELLKSQLLNL